MILLHALVEGVSEETFARNLLAPHLALHDVFLTSTMVTTNRRLGRAGRGGLTNFIKARNDLVRLMREKVGAQFRFTTMFDFYRLPTDFPGVVGPSAPSPFEEVKRLENCLAQAFGDSRLLPYLQLHEFESLILADPAALTAMFPDQAKAIVSLGKVVKDAGGPELVNTQEPPSKRIQQVLPAYDKVVAAAQLSSFSDLDTLRSACPHFADWLSRLESLAA